MKWRALLAVVMLACSRSPAAVTAVEIPVQPPQPPAPAEAPVARVEPPSHETATVEAVATEEPEPSSEVFPAPSPPPVPTLTNRPADCATPFFFDANGVKHYKPQCLNWGGKPVAPPMKTLRIPKPAPIK